MAHVILVMWLPRHQRWIGWTISLFIFTFIVVCTTPPPSDYVSASASYIRISDLPKLKDAPKDKEGDVLVKCDLSTPFDKENAPAAKGTLYITVHRGLAPLASSAFLDMVTANHFDHNYLFRVVQNFIVQWGITQTKDKFPKVNIDPPPQSTSDSQVRSNVRGALNFAGGNSGSGQVYINRKTNVHLDKEPGSLPFATLNEESMKIIDSVYSYKEGLGQVKAVKKGDEEVRQLFPRMSRIEKCWIDKT